MAIFGWALSAGLSVLMSVDASRGQLVRNLWPRNVCMMHDTAAPAFRWAQLSWIIKCHKREITTAIA